MWSFFIAASCLLAICQGQFRPPSPMGGAMAPPINGMMGSIFRRGLFSIDFNKFNSLEGICSHAFRMKGNGDHLSDLMRTAVQYKMRMGANPMTLGGTGANSGKWNCLLSAATRGWTDPNGASNGVGDYFDTAAELRIQPFLPFQFNPCTMVFCGERGMTPMAMAREVMMRLQMGRPLGGMANVFGQHAAKLASRARAPPMGAAPGGGMMGMGGVNPMQGMSMMGGGMPNMPRMSTMPGMANMQQMMKMMSAFGAGAAKFPSTNAVSLTSTGTDPSAAGTGNATGNTVTANQGASAPKPAPSAAPSTSPAVSNTVPSGNMMANALKAMTSGMGGGMGMPGMGMPGMGMPGMGMPGMGMPGMGMPGMGMPGMGMPGMGMPGMGMGMPGMGGMGGMGGMLGAMMMGEYLMDMPDPPAYGMRGGYGMPGSQMGMGGMPGMPGMSGMPSMPAPAPPHAAPVRAAAPMYRSPMPARLPPPPARAPMAAPARTPPSGMGALADIFKALG